MLIVDYKSPGLPIT